MAVNTPSLSRLTVLHREGKWCRCRCACGKELDLRWQDVRRGTTKSCGCLRIEMLKNRCIKPIAANDVFGRLTVLCYAGKRCQCRCACGQELWVVSTRLRTGHTQSCGCYQKEQARKAATKTVAIGTQFNSLTVLAQEGRFCSCRCQCGSMVEVETNKLRFGHVKSCGCARVAHALKMSADKVLPSGEVAFNSLYAQYRVQAVTRQLAFDLTPADFKSLTGQNCVYCGVEPKQVKRQAGSAGTYVYNGIDRQDNQAGYTLANSWPCCWACNAAKHDRTEEDFLHWLKMVGTKPVNNISSLPEYGAQHQHLYNRYANTARSKGHQFTVDKIEFVRLTSSPCALCGRNPYRPLRYGGKTILYTGIDRLDNGAGYVSGNVQSCCWDCNNAKGTGSVQDFLAWAARVVKHRNLC